MKEDQQHPIDSAAHVIAKLAREGEIARATPRKAEGLDAAPFVVLRGADGFERVEPLLFKIAPPHRKTGTVKLHDADSFILYYQQHGNGSNVYATLQPAQFVAVLNDHEKDKAGWRDYRAEFRVKHSKEFDIWNMHNGSGAAFNSTESFALFIEENIPDIVKPDGATMLAIALNFKMAGKVNFQQATRLQDGNIDFAYSNLVEAESKSAAGNRLKIPELFTIEIPVFDGLSEPKYRIDARFRYRLGEGRLSLWYELVRPHKTVEAAFKAVWEKIQKATKAPILHGEP